MLQLEGVTQALFVELYNNYLGNIEAYALNCVIAGLEVNISTYSTEICRAGIETFPSGIHHSLEDDLPLRNVRHVYIILSHRL